MTGFLIRKNFYDLWDNLFRIALLNIGFILSLAIPVFIPPFLPSPVLQTGIILTGVLWCFIYLSAAALSLKAVSDYGDFGFADFFMNLKIIWPMGLFMGGLACLSYLLFTVVIPFYLSMNSMPGLLLAALVFWAQVIVVLALQFFFAVRSRLDTNLFKIIKKCFIIFLDNPLFCIFTLIHNLVMLILSGFLAFLFPGPAAILLFLDEGLRLRLLKYDWLEANPQANRREIPWDELLSDDKEKTGTRSIRGLFFPWKD